MSKYLGIDYGTKRVGVAVSDDEGKMAFPLDVLQGKKEVILREIKKIFKERSISEIILGLPRSLDNRDTNMTKYVREFAKDLETLGLPIRFEDEFFSSKEARRFSPKKGKIDASAAAIILQSYLERQRNMIE